MKFKPLLCLRRDRPLLHRLNLRLCCPPINLFYIWECCKKYVQKFSIFIWTVYTVWNLILLKLFVSESLMAILPGFNIQTVWYLSQFWIKKWFKARIFKKEPKTSWKNFPTNFILSKDISAGFYFKWGWIESYWSFQQILTLSDNFYRTKTVNIYIETDSRII